MIANARLRCDRRARPWRSPPPRAALPLLTLLLVLAAPAPRVHSADSTSVATAYTTGADSLSFSNSRAEDERIQPASGGVGVMRQFAASRLGQSGVGRVLLWKGGLIWLLAALALVTVGWAYRRGSPALTELPLPAPAEWPGRRNYPVRGAGHPLAGLEQRLPRRAATLAIVGHLLLLGVLLVVWILPEPAAPPRPVRLFTLSPRQLAPPPSLGGGSPAPAALNIAEAVEPPPIAIPEPVPDLQAESPTIATQQQMSDALAPLGLGSGTGDGDSLGIGGLGDGTGTGSPAPDPGGFVLVEEGPVRLRIDPPVYPELARKASVEGTVLVRALVGKDGRVTECVAVEGSPMLRDAAIACARTAVFKPALAQNKPVEVWVVMPVTFRLH